MFTNNNKLNNLIELFGSEFILNELAKAMDSRELHDDLEYISNNYDLELAVTNYNKNHLYGVLDELISMLGADNALTELTKAMDSRELDNNVTYIDRMLNA